VLFCLFVCWFFFLIRCLDIRGRKGFTLRTIKPWNKLPREVVESSLLEILEV